MSKKKHLLYSFKYAFQGIVSAFKTERNMKIHVAAVVLVTIAGLFFKISKIEWMICIILFGMVISLELANTAIETTVDIAMPEKNEKAKLAKDIAAGAVLVCAFISLIIGGMIFVPKICAFITNML